MGWMYRQFSFHFEINLWSRGSCFGFRPHLPCVSGVTRVGADIIVPCHMEINEDYQQGI